MNKKIFFGKLLIYFFKIYILFLFQVSSESKKHIYSELTRFKALLRALPGPLCRDLISLNLTFFF